MPEVRLGRTQIVTPQNGFGALPIQRIPAEEAEKLLKKAYQNGITYFDTARGYTNSEEKLGNALSEVRHHIFIATKTGALTAAGFWKDLEQSLRMLKTDYIDVYQFHNPPFLPLPGGEDGLYDAMCEAKKQGKIRFIGITNHRYPLAMEAVKSGLYSLLQFPFSYLADEREIALVEECKKQDVGFAAMKALSGGLIQNAAAAYAFISQYDNVLPLWGIQRERELDEFLSFQKQPPQLDASLQQVIAADREGLAGNFCRGCGYCLPCPAGINIPIAARMSLLLRRSPVAMYTTPQMQEEMKKIEQCIHCNHCKSHCPYGLDTPALLQENYEDYRQFTADLKRNAALSGDSSL